MRVVRLSNLRTGRLYSKEIFVVLISVKPRVDRRAIVLLEELFEWKIPVTPSGIDSATIRLVAQSLNQLQHRVPHQMILKSNNILKHITRHSEVFQNNSIW
jgi:hypothetical protein